MKKLLQIIALLISFASFSQILDTTFDTDGLVSNQFSNIPTDDLTTNAVLQTDGKMIIIGRSLTTSIAFVCRLGTNGALDTTFNNYGYRKFSGVAGFECVKVQSDGKIIVAGMSQIYRLNTDGSLDTTWGTTGGSTQSINGYPFYIREIAIQSDGKVVMAGHVTNGTNNDFGLIRINADGSLDNTFGTGGKQSFNFGNNADEAFALAIQTDGKILIAGQTFNGTNYDFAIARLTTAGILDTTFGSAGKTITALTGIEYGKSIELQSDGKILLAGSSAGKLAVLRYTSSGNLDTTFNATGYYVSTVLISIPTSLTGVQSTKPRVKYLSSGKIITSYSVSTGDFGLTQFNSNGTLDTAFGTSGNVVQNFNTIDTSNILIVNSAGKIITGGTTSPGGSPYKITYLQFSATGVYEFSNNPLSLVNSNDNILQTIELADGKTISLLANGDIVKFNTNGSIDTAFGTAGTVTTGVASPYFLKKQADGRLLLNDQRGGTNAWSSLKRFYADGLLDTTFGVAGTVDIEGATNGRAWFIDNFYPLANGKILVTFDYNETLDNPANNYASVGLMYLNADGSLDTSFGTNGYTKMRFNTLSPTSHEYPFNVFIQSTGKIVVSAFLNSVGVTPANYIMGLTRFNANGTLDTTFGTNGIVTYNGTGTHAEQLIGLADDKFIINLRNNGTTNTIKYNANGSIDTTFGAGGYMEDNSGTYNYDMILQADGKILKGGIYNSQYNISRYNANGFFDATFGTNGSISTPINYFSKISNLLLLQNGKLLAGGTTFDGFRYLAAQAKYTNLTLGTLDFDDNITAAMVYPNPIVQETTFDFDLKNTETVSVEIIDIQGKTVQTISKNQELTAGNHKQKINVSNLSSGNYILKFSSPTGSQSIKIIKD
jgi:uncharacterized delta-60 repeat protein